MVIILFSSGRQTESIPLSVCRASEKRSGTQHFQTAAAPSVLPQAAFAKS